MTSRPPSTRGAFAALEAVTRTDPSDAGCEAAFALVHRYAEILTAGGDPDVELPRIGVHLRACPPCAEDLLGLLAALRAEASTW